MQDGTGWRLPHPPLQTAERPQVPLVAETSEFSNYETDLQTPLLPAREEAKKVDSSGKAMVLLW